jgi:DNA-binding protein HU-beta
MSVPIVQPQRSEFKMAKAAAVKTTKTATKAVTKTPAAPKAAKAATAAVPTVTLKHIAAELAETHEMTKKQANAIMDDLVATLVKNLKKGNRVRMAGLGILQVRKRAARMGRNPATGEAIKIPAKKKIAFRAAKELKEAVGK